MWDLIVSVPDHCLSFYFGTPQYFQEKCKVSLYRICLLMLTRVYGDKLAQ